MIISNDYGYLSYIIELKILKIVMGTQLEMYLIQMNVHITFDIYFTPKFIHIPRIFIYYIKLLSIFIIAFFYRKFYRDKLAKLMDALLFFITKIFRLYIN